ncbi:hypothetical protein [Asaia astilbis]
MAKKDDFWFNSDEDLKDLERRAGIEGGEPSVGRFVLSLFLPCLLFGIFLLAVFWAVIFKFRLLG